MPRFITCIVKNGTKNVRVLEGNNFYKIKKQLKYDNTGRFGIKYIRRLEENEPLEDDGLMFYWGREYPILKE